MRIRLLIALAMNFVILSGALPPDLPDDVHGLIWFPCNFDNLPDKTYKTFHTAVYNIWDWHGYKPLRRVGSEPGSQANPKLEDIIDLLNRGIHGLICIWSHGAPEWLAVEFYPDETSCTLRLRQLIDAYGGEGLGYAPYKEYYCIMVRSTFLQRVLNGSLPNSLVFVNCCHSASGSPSIASAFRGEGGDCVFGWKAAMAGVEAQAPIGIFYRMGGRNFTEAGFYPVVQDELRNKSAHEALTELEYGQGNLVLYGDPDMKLYNSPRIVGVEITQAGRLIYRYGFDEEGKPPEYPYEWDYPGDLSGCPREEAEIGSQPLEIKILFSAPMDPALTEVRVKAENTNFMVNANGSFSSVVFNNDLWQGTCEFSEWHGGGDAVLVVDGEDAFKGDINAKLDTDGDGNSNGEDTNHKFKVKIEPPQVTDHEPGSDDVDIYQQISITFSKPMDTTATLGAIRILNLDDSSDVTIQGS